MFSLRSGREGMRRLRVSLLALTIAAVASASLSACSASRPDLTGLWQADDGSGLKTVEADGRCTGMYYYRGSPLDIGGVMTCTLGDRAQDGDYLLVVRQPPNETTYRLRFEGDDSAVLLDGSGAKIVALTRQ